MKGYDTCVVNTNEHSNAPHHAGPLPLEFMRLSQMAVQAGVQQTDNGCGANRPKMLKLARDIPASNSTTVMEEHYRLGFCPWHVREKTSPENSRN